MITGLTEVKGQDSQARTLAHQYMQKYYPEYYQRYSNQIDREYNEYLVNADQFTWDSNFVSDPDGNRDLDAAGVLKVLFDEQ